MHRGLRQGWLACGGDKKKSSNFCPIFTQNMLGIVLGKPGNNINKGVM
jgi:hypothetical protein